jgi:signal transduction histidine kinase
VLVLVQAASLQGWTDLPGFRTAAFLNLASGILFCASTAAIKHLPAKAALSFFRALFMLAFVYPSEGDLLVWSVSLLLFAVESAAVFGPFWPLHFAYSAMIIVFAFLFPRQAWGRPASPPDTAALAIAAVLAASGALLARRFLAAQGEIERKEAELAVQRELVDQVYQLNAAFQEYALEAGQRSAADERKRITRDIHDIMGYTLVNLRVMLEVALDLAGSANRKLSDLLSDAIAQSRDALQRARRDLRNLRDMEERGESWMNRLQRIADTFSRATGVGVSVSFGNATRANCPRLQSAVYQFVQEALTNAFRHGRATEVSIDLRIDGEAPDDRLTVRVVDNGQGAENPVPGIGFAGIRERVDLLDGETAYRSLPGGFEIRITIPVLSLRKEA